MNRIQTRALVEGAVFAAVTVVIGIIGFYIPIISLISVVWSVPTILVAFRHGFRTSVISSVASSILVSVLTQPMEGLRFFIGFGLPGIIMGYLLKKKQGPVKTIFITGVVLAAASIVTLYLGMLAIGVNIANAYDYLFGMITKAYNEASSSMLDMYSSIGVSREELLKSIAVFEKSIDLLKLTLPAILLLSGLMLAYLNFKLTRLVLKRINHLIDDVKPFSMWRLSKKWGLFSAFILLLAIIQMSLVRAAPLNALTLNIFTILSMTGLVLGVSVAKFFFDKHSVPKALKAIILFFLIFAFGNATMLLGVFDMVLDLRKLKQDSI
ncbi:MAG: YybS family protein [Clostridia bacterium]|nr:YybS family protein [Clostridia bacterium]